MNPIFKAISEYLENENEDVKVTIEIDSKKRKEKSKLTLLLRGKILNGRGPDVDLQVEVVSRPSVHKTRKDKIISRMNKKMN